MYYIVYVDGSYRAAIDQSGIPNRYSAKMVFKTKKQAEAWVKKKSYPGMSHGYEVLKAE